MERIERLAFQYLLNVSSEFILGYWYWPVNVDMDTCDLVIMSFMVLGV